MNNLITYILELNIVLVSLYLLYQVLFKKDSNFRARRNFLYISMVLSVLIPLFQIHFANPSTVISATSIELDELLVTANYVNNEGGHSFSLFEIILSIYILVSSFFIFKLMYGLIRISIEKLRSEVLSCNGIKIYRSDKLHASSFFNTIFLDPSQLDEKNIQHVLDHELSHVQFRHSTDRILSELILSFSWFNPLAWRLRKSVVVNHEYQADNRVIEQGTDHISYQLTILNQYIGSATITNQFSNQIKNRIKMLNKNYKKGSFWKSFLLIPVSVVLFFFVACNNEADIVDNELADETETVKKSAEEMMFFVVEEMPQWPGEDDFVLALRKYIAVNIMYPDSAKLNGVQGKVFIKFYVDKEGNIVVPEASQLPPSKDAEDEVVVVTYRKHIESDPMPKEEYIQALKDEAVRVIESIPTVIPGKQRGKNVNVMYTMPINFVLQ